MLFLFLCPVTPVSRKTQALTTIEPNETISLMRKYNADNIFFSKDDAFKLGVFFKIAEKDSTTYSRQKG